MEVVGSVWSEVAVEACRFEPMKYKLTVRVLCNGGQVPELQILEVDIPIM